MLHKARDVLRIRSDAPADLNAFDEPFIVEFLPENPLDFFNHIKGAVDLILEHRFFTVGVAGPGIKRPVILETRDRRIVHRGLSALGVLVARVREGNNQISEGEGAAILWCPRYIAPQQLSW